MYIILVQAFNGLKDLSLNVFFTNEDTVRDNTEMISPSDMASEISSSSNNMMGYELRRVFKINKSYNLFIFIWFESPVV